MMKRTLRAMLLVTSISAIGLAGLSCGGDDDSNPVNPPGADVTINILGEMGSSSYSPSPDTVTVGQRVRWHNANGTTHTATANAGGFNTSNVGAGGNSGAIQMNAAGSFGYHCTIHPGMTGTLVVRP